MIFGEWNWDTAKRVWQDEAREEGRKEGIGIGMEKAREKAREEAREKARKEDRQYFLDLLNQGLSVDEIKERLKNQWQVQ